MTPGDRKEFVTHNVTPARAYCHLNFVWDFRPHPFCASDGFQQPSSSHQKWNLAEQKRENTGLKETAKTSNLSQQPEFIFNAGKVKLRHRLPQPGFAHCLFSRVPPDAPPPHTHTQDLHLEEAFVPSSEWFPFVRTLSTPCHCLPPSQMLSFVLHLCLEEDIALLTPWEASVSEACYPGCKAIWTFCWKGWTWF